ncbi:MAG: acyltransferase family protein [Henriciella sp.]
MTDTLKDYRADLDGARAIAVLSVILYHLDTELLPGGFLGVDIFFVLSGYFITRQITGLIARDDFRLVGFFDRRIRRLFPALFLMLFATSIAACWLLLPEDLVRYSWTFLGAVFSTSNFVFWNLSGYFSAEAQFDPLLHTWSLGVEEQFYLLFPALILLVSKFAERWLVKLIVLAVAASFLLSLYTSTRYISASFFLLPTRAWELGLGVLLALNFVRSPHNRSEREIASAIGLAAVFGSILFLDKTYSMPGPWAAPACIGTSLLIWAGLGAERDELPIPNRLLLFRPMVFIGLLSYSLYLWHWPIFSLAAYSSLEPLTGPQKLALLGFTFGVSFLSWKFVETPMRRGTHIWPTVRDRYIGSGLAMAACAILAVTLVGTQGLPSRFASNVVEYSAARNDFSPVRDRCHASGTADMPYDEACTFGPKQTPGLVIFADSHGSELAFSLGTEAEKTGTFHVRQLTGSLCPPSIDFKHRQRPNCDDNTELWLRGIETEEAQTIIIVAFYMRWHENLSLREDFWDGLDQTIARLTLQGHRVILLDGVPQHKYTSLPVLMARRARFENNPSTYRFERGSETLADVDERLTDLSVKHGVEYFPLVDTICGTAHKCNGAFQGKPIYFDDQHITVSVADYVRDEILLPAIRAGE